MNFAITRCDTRVATLGSCTCDWRWPAGCGAAQRLLWGGFLQSKAADWVGWMIGKFNPWNAEHRHKACPTELRQNRTAPRSGIELGLQVPEPYADPAESNHFLSGTYLVCSLPPLWVGGFRVFGIWQDHTPSHGEYAAKNTSYSWKLYDGSQFRPIKSQKIASGIETL